MPPKFDPSEVKEITLRATGGEVGASSALAPKIGPLGLSPKKVGEDIAKATGDWKGLRVTVKLTIQNRQAAVSVVPSASSLVIKALKEPPRDRKKEKNIKHSKSIPLEEIISIARTMQFKSLSKDLAGTVKEVLGTAFSVGCQVDGRSPKDVSDDVSSGAVEIAMYPDVRQHQAELRYYPLLANDAQPSASQLGGPPSFLHDRGRHEESKLRLHRSQRATSYANHGQRSSPFLCPTTTAHAPSPGVAEDMLRRKTPNGTLDASYDGRLLDWGARRPANKHVLLPHSDTPRHVAFQAHVRHKDPFASSESKLSHCQRDIEPLADSMSSCTPDTKDFPQGHMESRGWSLNPGLDSVLYQGSPSYQLGPSASGQQAPTMMQPMWPPCIGVTTLNRPRAYGPHWSNGVPGLHRPVPVPDSGPCRSTERAIRDCATQLSQLGPGLKSACLPDHAAPFDAVSLSHLPCESPMSQDVRTLDYTSSTLSALRELQMTSSTEGDLLSTCQDAIATGNRSQPRGEVYQPTSSFDSLLPLVSSRPASGAAEQPFKRCIQTSNVQFKERALIWAHRVYVALTSSRYPARQVGQHGQHQNHRHSPQAVFLAPPRQTILKLPKIQDTPRAVHTRQDLSFDFNNHTLEAERFDGGFEKSDTPPYYTAVHRTLGAACKQYQRDIVEVGQGAGLHETIPSVVFPGISTLVASAESTPSAAAVTALELLSRLCHESGWTWIDGLLLGGCLAYALGDYAKALKWYAKVVSCDAK
ncbi:MAG: hypothetical protein Q9220_007649 [cf. Caloplaca sp. 1 TL-2023]